MRPKRGHRDHVLHDGWHIVAEDGQTTLCGKHSPRCYRRRSTSAYGAAKKRQPVRFCPACREALQRHLEEAREEAGAR